MEYTAKQIENAKRAYNSFIQYTTIEAQNPHICGYAAAEQRAEFHNKIIDQIRSGNKEVEREWKLFFLNEEVKADQKEEASKAKLAANKAASSDILAPVKAMKKLGEFGKWLNTPGNPFRKEHFNKKYTQQSVETFINQL